jgi:hypothetical protein
MEEISTQYEKKTGIKISLAEDGSQARSALSSTLNGGGVEYRASSSVRTKIGHQKAIKGGKVYKVESAPTVTFDLINMSEDAHEAETTEIDGYQSKSGIGEYLCTNVYMYTHIS